MRMERHQSNAIAVALYLRNSKKVAEVIYPGARMWMQYVTHELQDCRATPAMRSCSSRRADSAA